MPYSFNTFDDGVKKFVLSKLDTKAKILDVGAGAGKYGSMFYGTFHIDAIEIFTPNIEKFNLKFIYNKVMPCNVTTYNFKKGEYDLVILGDVLEHLTVPEAQTVLWRIRESGAACLVLVPYQYPQGPFDGNDHEDHKQEDLTREVFDIRYPNFTLLFENSEQGVFFKDKP